MRSLLVQRVHEVQSEARRLILLYGLARFVAASILTAIGLGLIDYLLRLHYPVARWLVSASFAVMIVASVWKCVVPVLRPRQDPIGTARRIELRFPELGDRLSSAMAFIDEAADDRMAGSLELRRAVIADAEARAGAVEFRAALDRCAPRRALTAAGIALAFAALIVAISPSMAELAVSRLLAPWRSLPWPRKHELMFVNAPSRVATGDDFEAVLVDRQGTFPDDLQIQIRRAAGSGTSTENRQIKAIGGQAVFRLENVTGAFEYRARGGDDDTMQWLEVATVEPPKILELQLVVSPPDYSGLAPRAEKQIVTALVGSRLEIQGKVDQVIQAASLKPISPAMALPTVEITSSGRNFHAPAKDVPWTIERSGAIELELTDQYGMKFGRGARFELHAVEDQPPSINWEAPEDHVFVTAAAALPIRATIKDDLAVQSIQLRYLRARKSDEEEVIDFYTGPDMAAIAQHAVATRPAVFGEGEVHQIHSTWDLSRLGGLVPGDSLAIRITAEDYKPHFATTSVRRITVITAVELETRIAARQSAVVGQLAEALRVAQQCREQTKTTEGRIRETGRALSNDLSMLEAARYSLRQVQQLIGSGGEGAARQINGLLDELAANRMDQDSAGQRLRTLWKQVKSVEEQSLPAIDQELVDVMKMVREASLENTATIDGPECAELPVDELVERLRRVSDREEQVIQELERMTGALSQWDNFTRIAREVGQIRIDQNRLADDTDDLKLKAVSGESESPTAARASGRQLSQRQLELARRLDKLETRMEGMLARLTSDDPLSAAALADALDAARRLAIGGRMREAAARLTQSQLSQARQSEQEALDALKVLIETLSMRRDHELARGLAGLHQAAGELRGLRERLTKATGEAGRLAAQSAEAQRNSLMRLRRELDEIAKAGQQLARRLQRLQATRAAAALGQSGAASGAAAEAAGADRASDAQSQAETSRIRLDEATQELIRAIAAAEEELAREQLAQVGQVIAGIVARQKNVISETKRLDEERNKPGAAASARSSELKNVAAEQRLLAQEASQLKPRFKAVEVFSFAIESAASKMQLAGDLLSRGETTDATQDAERAAAVRLEQIVASLEADVPTTNREAAAGGQGQQNSPAGNVEASTAEIKLVRALQQTINERTGELESLRVQAGELNANQQRDLETLAREQGRLADMVLGWIKTTGERPEVGRVAK
jgi:hypothetical protein